jgi:hypothetical protein
MPLPKMPTKPAALLSPKDYPKAESGKPSKAVKVAHTEKTRAAENQAATAKKAQTPVATQKAGLVQRKKQHRPKRPEYRHQHRQRRLLRQRLPLLPKQKFLISALNRVSAVLPTNQESSSYLYSIPMS